MQLFSDVKDERFLQYSVAMNANCIVQSPHCLQRVLLHVAGGLPRHPFRPH